MMPEDESIETRRAAAGKTSARPNLGVTPLLTSEGSGWRGFGAERYLHSLGEIDQPPLEDHLVAVAIGAPCDAVQQLAGDTREGRYLRGDACLIPAGRPARWLFRGEIDVLHARLDPALLHRIAAEEGLEAGNLELRDDFRVQDPRVERVVRAFGEELEEGGPGGLIYAESLANVLTVELLRRHSSLGRGAAAKLGGGNANTLGRRELKRATDYVGDNLGGDLSLEAIARAARLSPHHFARLFKGSTGSTPHQYVIRERVHKARALLSGTDLTIPEVARRCGFASQSHLAYHTRRLLGASPRSLR